jgi:cell shape-determining protein MreC
MTTFDRRGAKLASPLAGLVGLLALASVLACLPESRAAPLREAMQSIVAPGQSLVSQAHHWTSRRFEYLVTASAEIDQIGVLADEVHRLQLRNEELEAALALARPGQEESSAASTPLVGADLVGARVLGRQARVFLQRAKLIESGADFGLEEGDLALATTRPLVDQGANVGLAVNDLAIAGRRVWGRLEQVGPHTSSIRRATDAGFREVIELAHCDDGHWHITARGVLEGKGEALARVSMVAVTHSVSVGDFALAASLRGVVSAPLVFGRIERVERRPGMTHWDIWVTPAVGPDEPGQVEVLRLKSSPRTLD